MSTNPLVPAAVLKQQIAIADSVPQLSELRHQAEALRRYVKATSQALAKQNEAAEVKIRADRRLGEILAGANLKSARQQNLKKGTTRKKQDRHSVTLDDLGISKAQSHRYQQLAAFEEGLLQAYLDLSRRAALEITTTGFLKFAKSAPTTSDNDQEHHFAIACRALIHRKEKFSCILVDLSDSSTGLGVEQLLKELPIGKLVEKRAHMHVFATDSTLASAVGLIDRAKCRLVSSVVWSEAAHRSAPYWPCRNYFLLLGVRGQLPFKTEGTLLELSRPSRVSRPNIDAIQETLEQVSVGPYLHLFADRPREDWTAITIRSDV